MEAQAIAERADAMRFLGMHARGIVVYREALPDRRNFDCTYREQAVHVSQLEDTQALPPYAWPGGYEMAYYVTSDRLTDGPYCATCTREMAISGNYFDAEAETSGGIMAECTDSWSCPKTCSACPAIIGPSMHCGPRADDGSCEHCGEFLPENAETAL